MIRKLRLAEVNADAISKVIRSKVVQNKLKEIQKNFYGSGKYREFSKDHTITDVRCTIDDVSTDVMFNKGIWHIVGHVDIKWDYDSDYDTVGSSQYFDFYYNPITDSIVDDDAIVTLETAPGMVPLTGPYTKESKQRKTRHLCLTENLKKPYVDWDELVRIQRNGIDAKNAKDFSTTYRLNKDFDLDLKSEVYKWFIQDNLLADLIENEDFWVAEDGHVYIPKGTEFTFYFYPDDDGRHLYIYFLNVPELKSEPEQMWIDRAYNQDDWAYDIINDSTPIDDGDYFAESVGRGKYRKK